MPTNLRLMNVRWFDTCNGPCWSADVWYGGQQMIGHIVMMGEDGRGPETVFLDPNLPGWREAIAQFRRIRGV